MPNGLIENKFSKPSSTCKSEKTFQGEKEAGVAIKTVDSPLKLRVGKMVTLDGCAD